MVTEHRNIYKPGGPDGGTGAVDPMKQVGCTNGSLSSPGANGGLTMT
jgi:hypothetical protein